jgi:ureidoglycolate hydrolase
MKITVQELSKEVFAPWGYFVSRSDTTGISHLSTANYMGNLAAFDLGGRVSLSILNPFKREPVLKFMELHRETHEICVALYQDCIVTAARDNAGEPDPASLEAFYLKEGDTVVYAPGVWHWVPFAARAGECAQLIIYKDQTGANDFFKKELSQSAELQML